MAGLSKKNARRLAWVIFILGCLLVVFAIGWFFKDGLDPAMAKLKGSGGVMRQIFVTVWTGLSQAITVAINAFLGSFTGTNFEEQLFGGELIGHWMMIGLIFLAFVAFVFFLLFFAK